LAQASVWLKVLPVFRPLFKLPREDPVLVHNARFPPSPLQ